VSVEGEFLFFTTVAEQIGKRLEILTRSASSRLFADSEMILALISEKLTLVININENGLHYSQQYFQVNSVTKVHIEDKHILINKCSFGLINISNQASV
jgi:hypothetical protein